MSKTVNSFLISLALVICVLFGFSACKGPLDDLQISISYQGIKQVEGGYETTLELGNEETDRLTVQATISGAGGDVLKTVLWDSRDSDKFQIINKKTVGDKCYATIVAKSVTQIGHPAKLTISSIEKTSVNVTLFVNIIAKATKVTERNNTAVAVKGSVYEPNVSDFFDFSDDNGSSNVTIPNYDYVLNVTTTTGEVVLHAGDTIPLNAVSMTIKFTPNENNVFTDSEIYSPQGVLNVPSSKVVLYESLEEATFDLLIAEDGSSALNENGIFEIVINRDNGQAHNYSISGLNPESMSVSYVIKPQSAANSVDIYYNQDTGLFTFVGQEETNNVNPYIEFAITYKDRTIASTGKLVVNFAVVSYPDVIVVNGDNTETDANLTVFNNYQNTIGQELLLSISPYSGFYADVVVKLNEGQTANNLAWFFGEDDTAKFISNEGFIIKSGTKVSLRNVEDENGVLGWGTIGLTLSVSGASSITRALNITLDYGVEGIMLDESTPQDSALGKFILKYEANAETIGSYPISVKALPTNASAESISAVVVSGGDVVRVEEKDPVVAGDVITFSLIPLKTGEATVKFSAPTGASYTQKIKVYAEFNEYSLIIEGQEGVVGSVEYQEAEGSGETPSGGEGEEGGATPTEPEYARDANNNRIIKSIKVATGSTIDFNNVLSPANAEIYKIFYVVEDENIVTFMANAQGNSLAQLTTGEVNGTTIVKCKVQFYALDGGNLVINEKVYEFRVSTYFKVLNLNLSDTSPILYAVSESASEYVYNKNFSEQRISVYLEANGMADTYADNAEWKITSDSEAANSALSISSPFIKEDAGKEKHYYGQYIILKAKKPTELQSTVVVNIRVSLQDYNTTLSKTLTVTINQFSDVQSATLDISSIQSFNITKNTQTKSNSVKDGTPIINKEVELYVEQANALDASCVIVPNVRPTRATNRNVEYLVFDYNADGSLKQRTAGTPANESRLVSINKQTGKLTINSRIDGENTVAQSGRAVVFVLAQDTLKKYVDQITSLSDIDLVPNGNARPILAKIEVVVSDGEETAFRIYNASDFLKIYSDKTKNFEVMTDIYGVDLSLLGGVFDTTFGGKLSSYNPTLTGEEFRITRTITFAPIEIVKDLQSQKTFYNGVEIISDLANTDVISALFGKLGGTVSNLNFVVPSYTYKQINEGAQYVNANISVLAFMDSAEAKLEDVSLTVNELKLNLLENTGSAINFGVVAKNFGTIKNLVVNIPNAVFDVVSNANLSLGVAVNGNTTDNLADKLGEINELNIRGNVEIKNSTTNINFGGVVATNNAGGVAKNIQCNLNLTSNSTLNNLGGVVAQNFGEINDARFLVLNDGKERASYGINVNTAQNIAGVVAKNAGIVEYAYAAGFVDGYGIVVQNFVNLAGVAINVAKDATHSGSVDKTFSSLIIKATKADNNVLYGIAGKEFGADGDIGTVENSYSTSVNDVTDAINLKTIVPNSPTDSSIWGNNETYKSGYQIENKYYYLIKEGDAYLPPVPSSLEVINDKTILELTGTNVSDGITTSFFNQIDVDGSSAVAKEIVYTNAYNLFSQEGADGQEGLLNINYPPLSDLTKLAIYVQTFGDVGTLRVLEGVSAKDYRVQILGNGTIVLKIVSAYNKNAQCFAQICVMNGYATAIITDADGNIVAINPYVGEEEANPNNQKFNIKRNNPEEFHVVFQNSNEENLSIGNLGTNLTVTSSNNSELVVNQQTNSFVLTGTKVTSENSFYTLTFQKQWKAKFFDLTGFEGTPGQTLSSEIETFNGSEFTKKITVSTGPTQVLFNHNDCEMLAGDEIYSTVTVLTDDAFNNDYLFVYIAGQEYAKIDKTQKVLYKVVNGNSVSYEEAKDIEDFAQKFAYEINCLQFSSTAEDVTFDLVYSLTSPGSVAEEKTVLVKVSANDLLDVSKEFSLTIQPQQITSLTLNHYIDVIQTNETGELSQAGETPSNKFVSGSFGLMKVTIDPSYVDFDSLELRSDLFGAGMGVTFDQRVFNKERNVYEILTSADVSVTKNSIRTKSKQSYAGTTDNFDGTFYFRTFIPANTPPTSVFNVYAIIYNKDGTTTMIQNSKRFNIFAPSQLTISFDNYASSENKAFVALNTGGSNEVIQNQNIISITAETGLRNVNIAVANSFAEFFDVKLEFDGEQNTNFNFGTPTQPLSKQVYLVVKAKQNVGASDCYGKTFSATLTAQTYVSGVATTITRTIVFEVVDIVINKLWNTPEKSVVLSKTLGSLGGAISDVNGNEWNYVFSTTPIQLSFFATAKRANLDLLNNNLTLARNRAKVIELLKKIPEFSFDLTNDEVIERAVAVIKDFNINLSSNDQIKPMFYKLANSEPLWSGNVELDGVKLIVEDGKFYIKGKDVSKHDELYAYVAINYGTNGQISFANFDYSIEYRYDFVIAFNEQNSSLHPIPVYTSDFFYNEMKSGYSYILMQDITLNEKQALKPLNTQIASFDGNGYNLVIDGSKGIDLTSSNGNFGVFGTVDESTVLKNITIKVDSHDLDIYLSTTNIATFNVGLLAAINNGVITNCKITAGSSSVVVRLVADPSKNTTVNFGGLVAQNNGYITNSKVENIKISTNYGIVGGLVAQNDKHISACYVKNTTINNTIEKEISGLTALGGLVAQNRGAGSIYESYVGEVVKKENATPTDKWLWEGTLIKSNSHFGVFVYDNLGTISDCFTAAKFDNSDSYEVSGFAFENTGNIDRCYAVSKPANQQNRYYRPFIGTQTINGEDVSNNNGTIENSFYYKDLFNTYQQQVEVNENITLALAESDLTSGNSDQWTSYTFASRTEGVDGVDGVWTQRSDNTLGPQLVNANINGIADGVHQEISQIINTSGGAVYNYRIAQLDGMEVRYNTINYVALIASEVDFNNMFDVEEDGKANASNKEYYARIIKPLDLSILQANNIQLKTTTSILRGTIVGNNLLLGGVEVSYLDKVTNTESQTDSFDVFDEEEGTDQDKKLPTQTTCAVGLFGEIRGGSISNLNVELKGVYANNKTRFFVGGIAGRIMDGKIYNINIDGFDGTVLGYNIVGGVAGIVTGNSKISNIHVSHLSVTSDFEHNGANEEKFIYNYDLCGIVSGNTITKPSQLSVAGGVVGVLDLFERNEEQKPIRAKKMDLINSANLTFEGNNTVLGQLAAGVAGVVGANTNLTDAHHTIGQTSSIKASVFAGGLVAQNHGTITYSTVAYTQDVQKLVDAANTGAVVPTANSTLFHTISHTAAVGGLVGVNIGITHNNWQTGSIRYCSSSIYVDAPYSQNVGGLVGACFGGDVRAVYATGYVLGYNTGSVGGLIGTVDFINDKTVDGKNVLIDKLNIPTNIYVNVMNPLSAAPEIANQKLLIDFAVAQNNWATGEQYLNTYQTIQNFGYLGGFIGCITEKSLIITSHNGNTWEADKNDPSKQDKIIAINYFVNKIPPTEVQVNVTNTDSWTFKLNAANFAPSQIENYESLTTQEEIFATQNELTKRFASGETRNFAYSKTNWDWFALWDEFSIGGRNLDDTPIIITNIAPAVIELYEPKDFFSMYWHPDRDCTLMQDIDFAGCPYLMVGTSTTPFTGSFNGNGHIISNIEVENYLSDIGGLFGYAADAKINNLIVNNIVVKNTHQVNGTPEINNPEIRSAGGLIGYALNVSIHNVVLTNLTLDVQIQNLGKDRVRFVGGLAGFAQGGEISNVAVEGTENGIVINQVNVNGNEADELNVGGFIGSANNVKILQSYGGTENNDNKSLFNISNVQIQNHNVYSNTIFGSSIGTVNKTVALATLSSGEHKFDGTLKAKLTVGGIYGLIKGTENSLNGSYAYSTIKLTELNYAQGVGQSNVKVSYDFNKEEENSKINLTPAGYTSESALTQEEKSTIENTLFNTANGDEIDIKKQKNFSAVSILCNLFNDANKSITRYDAQEMQTVQGMSKNISVNFYIPLDPFYSLATVDAYYDIEKHDLNNAAEFYKDYLVFTVKEGERNLTNNLGYVLTQESINETVQSVMFGVVNKIGKLYYDNGSTTYGGAQVLSSTNPTINSENKYVIEENSYYIIVNKLGADLINSFDEINGFINGHNYALRIASSTLAKTINGVVTGVQLKFISNTFNQTEENVGDTIDFNVSSQNLTVDVPQGEYVVLTPNGSVTVADLGEITEPEIIDSNFTITAGSGSYTICKNNLVMWENASEEDGTKYVGVVANILSSTGVINACGTTALDNYNSKEIGTVELSLGDNCAFGGVAGLVKGTVNNCWSHIKYSIITSTENSIFGGIAGVVQGATIANTNYYGDIDGSSKAEEQMGGIIGLATGTSGTYIYQTMCYMFTYPGKYHITKYDPDRYHIVQEMVGGEAQNMLYYFSLEKDVGGLGTHLGFFDVFNNMDKKKINKNDSIFKSFWGIWDEEQDGFNFGMPTLKIEPKVESKDGRDEEHAIEIPNEQYFAEMLKYETSKAGRFYILTKDDKTPTAPNAGVYDLYTVLNYTQGTNINYTQGTNTVSRTMNGEGYYSGHLNGNNKILRWNKNNEGTPLTLIEEIENGLLKVNDQVVRPYIKNLTIENNDEGIMNLIANKNWTGQLEKIIVKSTPIVVPSAAGNYGVLVGANSSAAKIQDCEIKNITITASSTEEQNIGGVAGGQNIGGVAGVNAGQIGGVNISGTINQTTNLEANTSTTIGGVAGINSGKISSKVSNQGEFIPQNSLFYCIDEIKILFYDKTRVKVKLANNGFVERTFSGNTPESFTEGTYIEFFARTNISVQTKGEYAIYSIVEFNNELIKINEPTTVLSYDESQNRFNEIVLSPTSGNDLMPVDGKLVFKSGSYTKFNYFTLGNTDNQAYDYYKYGTFLDIAAGTTIRYYYKQDVTNQSNEIIHYAGQFVSEKTFADRTYIYKKRDPNMVCVVMEGGTVVVREAVGKSRSMLTLELKAEIEGTQVLCVPVNPGDIPNYHDVENGIELVTLKDVGDTIEESYNWHLNWKKGAYFTVVKGRIQFVSTTDPELFSADDFFYQTYRGYSETPIVRSEETKSNEVAIVDVIINTPQFNNVGGVAGKSSGSVQHLRILSSSISGKENVGGVVGVNFGSISDIQMYVQSITAVKYVGGIAGANHAYIENVIVQRTTITAQSAGEDSFAGGVVGDNTNGETEAYSNSEILNAKVIDVVVKGYGKTSGIAGYNSGTISVGYGSNTGQVILQNTTLNITSTKGPDDGNFVDVDYYVGYVTSENFGQIIFGSGRSVLSINNSIINFEQHTNYDSTTIVTKIYAGGIAGINYGVIERANIARVNDVDSMFNIKTKFLSNNANNSLFVGGLVGENVESGSVVKIQKIDMNIVDNAIVSNDEELEGSISIDSTAPTTYDYLTTQTLKVNNIVYVSGATPLNVSGEDVFTFDGEFYEIPAQTPFKFNSNISINLYADLDNTKLSIHIEDNKEFVGDIVGSTTHQTYVGGVAAVNNGFIGGSTVNNNVSSISSSIKFGTTQQIGGVVAVNNENAVIYGVVYVGKQTSTLKPTTKALTYRTGLHATTSSSGGVGGIAGVNHGLIMSAGFDGYLETAKGSKNTGGIAGANEESGIISSCSSKGTIKGYDNVGGIAGVNYGKITSSRVVSVARNGSETIGGEDNSGYTGTMVAENGRINAENLTLHNAKGLSLSAEDDALLTLQIATGEGCTSNLLVTANTTITPLNGPMTIMFITKPYMNDGRTASVGKYIEYNSAITFKKDTIIQFKRPSTSSYSYNVTISGNIYVVGEGLLLNTTLTNIDGAFSVDDQTFNIGEGKYSLIDNNLVTISTVSNVKSIVNGTIVYNLKTTKTFAKDAKVKFNEDIDNVLAVTPLKIKGADYSAWFYNTSDYSVEYSEDGEKYIISAGTIFRIIRSDSDVVFVEQGTISYEEGSRHYGVYTHGKLKESVIEEYDPATQTYLTQTESNINGTVGYTAGTSIQFKGTQTIPANAEITFAAGTQLTLNNIPTAGVSLMFGEGAQIVYGPHNAAFNNNVLTLTYNYERDGQSGTQTVESACSVYVNGGYFDYGTEVRPSGTDEQRTFVFKHTKALVSVQNPEGYEPIDGAEVEPEQYKNQVPLYLVNGATITFAQDTDVEIINVDNATYATAKTTETFNTDVSGLKINGEVIHGANTTITSADTTETFELGAGQSEVRINYEKATLSRSVLLPYTILGTDEFSNVTFAELIGISSGTATKYYENDDKEFVVYNEETDNEVNQIYNISTIDENTTLKQNAESTIDASGAEQQINISLGDQLMYSSSTDVQYEQNTTTRISGTVSYRYGNSVTITINEATKITNEGSTSINASIDGVTVTGGWSAGEEKEIAAGSSITISTMSSSQENLLAYNNANVTHNASTKVQFAVNTTEVYAQNTSIKIKGSATRTNNSFTELFIPKQDEEAEKSKSSGLIIYGRASVGGAVGLNTYRKYNDGHTVHGEMKNIYVKNVTIFTYGNSVKTRSVDVGGMVGFANGDDDNLMTTISNCVVENVEITKYSGESSKWGYAIRVGGFVGHLVSTQIDGNKILGKVKLNAGHTIGGFVGKTGDGNNHYNIFNIFHGDASGTPIITNNRMDVTDGSINSNVKNNSFGLGFEGNPFNIGTLMGFWGVDEDSQNLGSTVGHDPGNGEDGKGSTIDKTDLTGGGTAIPSSNIHINF